MNKTLFVGNLPFSMTEEQLLELFSAHGKVVSAKLISDKYSGQSRGFGFVEMAEETDATKAIEKLNQFAVDGRQIIVNEARPKEKTQRKEGFSQRKSRGRDSYSW